MPYQLHLDAVETGVLLATDEALLTLEESVLEVELELVVLVLLHA